MRNPSGHLISKTLNNELRYLMTEWGSTNLLMKQLTHSTIWKRNNGKNGEHNQNVKTQAQQHNRFEHDVFTPIYFSSKKPIHKKLELERTKF